jgi:hypothetical protein
MDISSPSLVPRAVADLRPAADAAATARIVAPPAALAQGPAVAPVSPAQGGLVARGFLEPRPVSPAGAVDGSGQAPDHPVPRVLKSWGVPMLPAEEETTPPHGRAGGPEASSEARARKAGLPSAEDPIKREPVVALPGRFRREEEPGGSPNAASPPSAGTGREEGGPGAPLGGNANALPEPAAGPGMLRAASHD